MKTLLRSLLAAAATCAAPLAPAATYEGSWTNTTFQSTGDLVIDLNIKGNKVNGSFDLNGNVFGGSDPAAIKFSATIAANGKGSFKRTGTSIGDVQVDFDSKGNLDILITNIPGGFLHEVRVDGKFNLALETFKGAYEIDNTPGNLFAEGKLEAHVKKAPVVKGPANVKFTGKKASATLRVTSNVKITSASASATNGAKPKLVKKGNKFILTVTKLKNAGSKVTVTVTNADGLTKIKVVRFKKK